MRTDPRVTGGRDGFTLVEILIAIVLVGILSAVVVVGVGSLTSKGSSSACQASADAARAAVPVHLTQTASYPASLQAMVTSGALSLPAGVTVDVATGRAATGNGWRMSMQGSVSSPVFLCSNGANPAGMLGALTTGVSAAYSLRRLEGDYGGPAVRVRRSSDNTESDIGFTSTGDLDTVALLAFVGSGNGFVRTWYDQSGYGRDAVQTVAANQPRIVNAGVVEVQGSRPVVRFLGSPARLATATSFAPVGTADRALIVVAGSSLVHTGVTSVRQSFGIDNLQTSNLHFYLYGYDVSSAGRPSGSFDVLTSTLGSSVLTGYANGSSIGSAARTAETGSAPLQLGGRVGDLKYTAGPMTEVVLIDGNLSTVDRQTLERNQGTYYGITVA